MALIGGFMPVLALRTLQRDNHSRWGKLTFPVSRRTSAARLLVLLQGAGNFSVLLNPLKTYAPLRGNK
jgi:hypothetical protein